MKIDNSFDRYKNNKGDPNYKRYAYSVSHLFGDVLDVGCGDGFGIYMMSKNVAVNKITGIDIQKEAIDRAIKNLKGIDVKLMIAAAENLPFESDSFDSVHCGQTLEHVKDDLETIEEIRRVVRERVVFSVPIKGGISEQHVREYRSQSQVIELLENYFEVISAKMFIDEKRIQRIVIVAEK